MVTTCWKTACSITIVGFLSLSMAHTAVAQGFRSRPRRLDTQRGQVQSISPGPTPKSGTVTFSARRARLSRRWSTFSPTDGSKIHSEYTATLDGKPAPVTGNPDGDMVVAETYRPERDRDLGSR